MIRDRRGAENRAALISLGIPKLVRFAQIRRQQPYPGIIIPITIAVGAGPFSALCRNSRFPWGWPDVERFCNFTGTRDEALHHGAQCPVFQRKDHDWPWPNWQVNW
jgi:hypothetical protein